MLLNCGVGEDSLRVPWNAKISIQSILKEINPEYGRTDAVAKASIPWPLDAKN